MRLKSLLFSLLMLAGFSMAQATVVEIGSTSLSNSYMPFYSYYDYSGTGAPVSYTDIPRPVLMVLPVNSSKREFDKASMEAINEYLTDRRGQRTDGTDRENLAEKVTADVLHGAFEAAALGEDVDSQKG